MGVEVRKYPAFFEDGYWSEDVPTLTEQDITEVGNLFTKLRNANRREFNIAVRRLNLALLREDEEDSILDATIGLEALCSDGSAQEIVYKLRLRVAALLQLLEEDGYSPTEVFNTVKRIYDYRSAVVHGKGSADKNREIQIGAKPKIPTVSKATEYLRKVLEALITYPEYLDTKKLDEELVLAKLLKKRTRKSKGKEKNKKTENEA
jgi:hypothetical protein